MERLTQLKAKLQAELKEHKTIADRIASINRDIAENSRPISANAAVELRAKITSIVQQRVVRMRAMRAALREWCVISSPPLCTWGVMWTPFFFDVFILPLKSLPFYSLQVACSADAR